MAGVTQELLGRFKALQHVCDALAFPAISRCNSVAVESSYGMRLAEDVKAPESYPPFSRSLRDGYAVRSVDVKGASISSPVFLRKCGIIPMGKVILESLPKEAAMQILTGGILPPGSDAVVMVEDTEEIGPWIEIRKGVMPGENVIIQGEEIKSGDIIARTGDLLDFKNIPAAVGLGVKEVKVVDLKIGILSTGDEIVEAGTDRVPPGCVRDVNSTTLRLLFKFYGYDAQYLGIIRDDLQILTSAVQDALRKNDAVILSGGSSVSTRDYCSEVIKNLGDPGLIVRGINMRPGKPTLIGGIKGEPTKLVVSLPGHPLSCTVVTRVVLLPLLDMMIGGINLYERNFVPAKMKCLDDVIGRSGVEEYVPVVSKPGGVVPVNSKSGYISALNGTIGLGMLPVNKETLRAGEEIEVILW